MKNTKIRGYYFIADASLSTHGVIEDVKNALAAGIHIIQYRNKSSDAAAILKEAAELRALCKNNCLIINDYVDIARTVHADGVHLGEDDLTYEAARTQLGDGKIIGLSTHSLIEAQRAARTGADYIALGPIFKTATKESAHDPCGVSLISEIKKHISVPLVAIGGITLNTAPAVIQAGADALCALSAVLTKDDVKKEVEKFQILFSRPQ